MAKQNVKKVQTPATPHAHGQETAPTPPPVTPPPPAAAPPDHPAPPQAHAEAEAEVSSVELTVPLCDAGRAYAARTHRVELNAHQAVALRDLAAGLRACDARLANGRSIGQGRDALVWLLEQVEGARRPR